MNQRSTLIYELKGLKKSYNNETVLNVGRLQFHRGTVYGIVGSVGSGKSTLMNIMAGLEKESEGTLKYDNAPFETNWLGKVKSNPEIKISCLGGDLKGSKVSDLFKDKSADQILSRYIHNGTWKSLLDRSVSDLSKGEVACINMALVIESDPRVLLVDDYGIYFDKDMESEFRKRLNRMNKDQGTTILLSSPHDQHLKLIASVLIYLDNGHIAKIRSGVGKGKGTSQKRPQQSGWKNKRRRQPRQRSAR